MKASRVGLGGFTVGAATLVIVRGDSSVMPCGGTAAFDTASLSWPITWLELGADPPSGCNDAEASCVEGVPFSSRFP